MAVVATGAFWLLQAGPPTILGFDSGHVGTTLLAATLWASLWRVSTLPEERLSTAASPSEWQAWIGLAFLSLAIVYFATKLHLFAVPGTALDNPATGRVARNVVLLVIAWTVLSGVMRSRWKGIQLDERDRRIAATAQGWSLHTLFVLIIALAVTLAFTPADRLSWATPLMLGNLLILMLMVSHWLEMLVQAVGHWRDRR